MKPRGEMCVYECVHVFVCVCECESVLWMHCENVTLELGSKGIVRSPIKLFPVLLLFDHFSVSYPVDSDARDALLISVLCFSIIYVLSSTVSLTLSNWCHHSVHHTYCMCTQLPPHVRMRTQIHTHVLSMAVCHWSPWLEWFLGTFVSSCFAPSSSHLSQW